MKLNEKELQVLAAIEKDARILTEDLAKMVDLTIEETEEILKNLEENKVIVKYLTMIDWTKLADHTGVRAMIDVKVTPKKGVGFDDIAKKIYSHDEVQSVYLMSGTYDLSIIIEGKSLNEVASFVAQKLSTLESVVSTTTHFILKKYKHDGIVLDQDKKDKRIVVS
jgi:DNA-binding Lrp family transcriptional regulator